MPEPTTRATGRLLPAAAPLLPGFDAAYVVAHSGLSPKLHGGTVTTYWLGPDAEAYPGGPRTGHRWATLHAAARFTTVEEAEEALRRAYGADLETLDHDVWIEPAPADAS